MGPAARSLLVVLALPVLAGARCSLPWGPGSGSGDTGAQWPQGWAPDKTNAWYTVSQGSRLIPRAWIDALEQPDQQAPFLDPAYIETFRYLPAPPPGAPGIDQSCGSDPALPLGFVLDCQPDSKFSITKLRWKSGQSDTEPWVGLNCSACHTTELTYQGSKVRVDGAPTLADFQSFTEALDKAMHTTLADNDKFQRFAAKVLPAGAPPGDADMLRGELTRLVAWNDQVARLNAAPIRYGFGRLDAVGHIFNRAALLAMADHPENQLANPADAPVSYPFLWNVPQQNKVEWNGLGTNSPFGAGRGFDFDPGALARNTAEVIGVFGDVTIRANAGLSGYESSVNVQHLVDIEEQLQTLTPPKWPAAFGAIDEEKANAGAALFVSKGCQSCHDAKDPTSLSERYTVALQKFHSANPADHPTNTDMWMTCNAVFDQANSGILKGAKVDIISGTVFADPSFNVGIVENTVANVLLNQKGAVVQAAAAGLLGIDRGLPTGPLALRPAVEVPAKQQRRNKCLNYVEPDPNNPQLVYKGRPLQGIWATAPYLHNGSVVSLYELLLPPSQRRASFYTGTREFDPKNVGFLPDQSATNSFLFQARDAAGKPIDGNSNDGHDYGNAALTDPERWELVEYMKKL